MNASYNRFDPLSLLAWAMSRVADGKLATQIRFPFSARYFFFFVCMSTMKPLPANTQCARISVGWLSPNNRPTALRKTASLLSFRKMSR